MTHADRLNSIVDCDQILVVDQGKIAEVGAPVDLLNDSRSHFHRLAERTGELDELKEMAEGKR